MRDRDLGWSRRRLRGLSLERDKFVVDSVRWRKGGIYRRDREGDTEGRDK